MKKNAIALLLFVASGAAFSSNVDESFSHAHKYSVHITEGSSSTQKEVSIVDTQEYLLVETDDRPYVSSCGITESGARIINSKKLATGSVFALRALGAASVKVMFRWDISKLVAIEKSKQGDCEIDLPHIDNFEGQNVLTLPLGMSASVMAGPYTIVVKRID